MGTNGKTELEKLREAFKKVVNADDIIIEIRTCEGVLEFIPSKIPNAVLVRLQ